MVDTGGAGGCSFPRRDAPDFRDGEPGSWGETSPVEGARAGSIIAGQGGGKCKWMDALRKVMGITDSRQRIRSLVQGSYDRSRPAWTDLSMVGDPSRRLVYGAARLRMKLQRRWEKWERQEWR